MEDKLEQVKVVICGRVQGVGFRWWVQKQAQSLKLSGWIKNLDDGRVEVLAQGNKGNLDILLKSLKNGPRFSKVNKIDISWEKEKNEFEGFEILH
jgi:acylphosphatase